ncbi:hypothetical protein CANARDRAFT_30807 [[Candida] arabinofermentans NRRL YB-2248]|uniref:Uncharacterized protein n=1 Tax=[Candida] arabinofermentans NRRL YB-2248 TaxID=983967 RepID=A0A1E4SSK6_9ASCO|nr:hypothetical protein CANARDRAFT_30807 [[Candida] arabinofermentans NRRL YB-2248]
MIADKETFDYSEITKEPLEILSTLPKIEITKPQESIELPQLNIIKTPKESNDQPYNEQLYER